jgi:hypothetical protein
MAIFASHFSSASCANPEDPVCVGPDELTLLRDIGMVQTLHSTPAGCHYQTSMSLEHMPTASLSALAVRLTQGIAVVVRYLSGLLESCCSLFLWSGLSLIS